ncbi:MAG: hypothetical protein KDD48_03480 [Bdellovibrionales bacterium]|nr:hypothetical protein [Bdellovibrionales bacterium]
MIKQGILLFLGILIASGCGTGVGNPGIGFGFQPEDSFSQIINTYQSYNVSILTNGINCGSFDDTSSPSEIEAGKECIMNAFTLCHPAKYLLNRSYPENTRFVSFVAIGVKADSSCTVSAYTASTYEPIFFGVYQDVCSSLSSDQEIEFACR